METVNGPSEGRIRIGTSGWNYDHWKGPFYPEKIPQKKMLAFYCGHFETVEINNTFYAMPKENSIRSWSEGTPDGFLFSVKANRVITHLKRLKDAEEQTALFFERVSGLGGKLGPVLFQLPPSFGKNLARLETFLQSLPKGFRTTFEFRDPDWFGEDTSLLLADYNSALCLYDFSRRQSPWAVTADYVYARMHGPDGPYQGSYTPEQLKGLAEDINVWAREGRDVYCYFDNDMMGFAAQNALALKAALGAA
ncbi:MAG TPA: DUF72 domain-containing protein [Nitrospirota bacterium]|jgi:uncharacterized protein YecE (DUF72 family)